MAEDLVDELEDFGAPPPRRVLSVEYVRDLTEGDIAALATRAPTRPKSLMRIHSSHHSLAKCLAAGMKHGQAALITGYSTGRISTLENDPAFRALVAEYRAEAKSIFADLAERMSEVSLDAIELLHERLHDAPQEFSVPLLLDVVKAFADRTGHGPGQELKVSVDRDFIDRPPRENFEEWQNRRNKELGGAAPMLSPPRKDMN
jgi:hypothetical protein